MSENIKRMPKETAELISRRERFQRLTGVEMSLENYQKLEQSIKNGSLYTFAKNEKLQAI
jgi:hypothetical protein